MGKNGDFWYNIRYEREKIFPEGGLLSFCCDDGGNDAGAGRGAE